MIKPLPNRVLVKVLPRYGAIESKLNLTLVDKKKHYLGARRGEVIGVGEDIASVAVGDIVWFHGAQGKTFDQNELGVNDGIGMRILRPKDLLCVEEPVIDEVSGASLAGDAMVA